jgi:hypothetical protein
VMICEVGGSCGMLHRVQEYSVACIVSDNKMEVFSCLNSGLFNESTEACPSCRCEGDDRQNSRLGRNIV